MLSNDHILLFFYCLSYGLFSQTSTSDRLLIPNTAARFLENGIQMIEFLGRVVGKALYEGILLDYSFSHVFVQKLLGRYSFLDELSTLDPELYRNLMYVKVVPLGQILKTHILKLCLVSLILDGLKRDQLVCKSFSLYLFVCKQVTLYLLSQGCATVLLGHVWHEGMGVWE